MPLAWSSIEENPRYQGLSEADKARVRDGYARRYGTRTAAPSDSDPTRRPADTGGTGGTLAGIGRGFARGAREYGGEALATAARGVRAVQAPFEEIAGQIEEAGPGMLKGAFGIPESVSGPPLRYVAGPAVRYIPLEAAAALTGGAAPMTEGAAAAATRFGPAALRFLGRTARAGTELGGYEAGTEGARQLAGETPRSAERVGEAGAAGFVGGAGLHVALGEVGIPLAERALGAGLSGIARLRARLAPTGRPGVGKAAGIPRTGPTALGPSTSVAPATPDVRPSAEAVRGGVEGTAAALRGGVEEGTTPGVPGAGEVQPAPGTAAPAIAVAPAPNNVMERAKLAADAEKGGQVAGAAPLPVHPASRPVAEGPPIPPAVQSVRADAAAAERAGDMDKAGRLRTLADAMLDAYRRKSGPPPTDLTVTPGGVAGPPGQPAYPVPAVLPEGAQPSRLPGEPQPEQIDLRERLLQMAQQRRAQQALGAPPGPP